MSRRGRSGPTISLFSFQDIITSVTAIVTVVTLLLALDLVNRKQSQTSESSATLGTDLAQRLEHAETELAQLRAQTASTDELVREVAATAPAELRNEILRRESRIEELERNKQRLEQQSLTLKSHAKEQLAERFDVEPLIAEAAAIERAVAELEQQRTAESAENRTIFTLPQGFEKEGWIAEIDSGQIQAAPIGRSAKPMTFVATGLPLVGSSAVDNLEKWIDGQNLSAAYFLLLVRPNAATVFDRVERLLTRKQISHGFDLVDGDQQILHPERGAVP